MYNTNEYKNNTVDINRNKTITIINKKNIKYACEYFKIDVTITRNKILIMFFPLNYPPYFSLFCCKYKANVSIGFAGRSRASRDIP